jgi:hypothetical protein
MDKSAKILKLKRTFPLIIKIDYSGRNFNIVEKGKKKLPMNLKKKFFLRISKKDMQKKLLC